MELHAAVVGAGPAGLAAALVALIVAAVSVLAVSNAQIRRESAARAAALHQKDAALATAIIARSREEVEEEEKRMAM